eukprot:2471007-Lingulodinium_polyedra.AAC.1
MVAAWCRQSGTRLSGWRRSAPGTPRPWRRPSCATSSRPTSGAPRYVTVLEAEAADYPEYL